MSEISDALTISSLKIGVDITHTWIGDLRVSVRSPRAPRRSSTTARGGSEDNIVKTFTAANTPPLAALTGQPAGGTWQLNVVDRSAQDQGKLNE